MQEKQQSNIAQSQKYKNEKLIGQHKISFELIAQTSLDSQNTKSLSLDQKIEIGLALKSIHLQWLNIKKIQNLQVFSNLNILYLQHNKIKKIEGLQTLINLQYLALNDNLISKSQNLGSLKKLLGLNLNNNNIQQIQYNNLPPKLQLLSFKNNPVTLDSGYKTNIFKYCKDLEMLDDYNVTQQDKFKALGIFPKHLIDYASKMKHFRSKRQIKAQNQQNENKQKPILLGGIINQKQALSQIRDKTKRYLEQSQQKFKVQTKDQAQNFEEKVKVSKKIRQIKEQQQKKKLKRLQKIQQENINQQDGQQTQQTKQ